MKTKSQIERDKRNGIEEIKHYFDEEKGIIVGEGHIHQEINPEGLLSQREMFRQKIQELEENLEQVKKQLENAPDINDEEVLKFIELQKKAGQYSQRKSLEQQVVSRAEELQVMKDDFEEQKELIDFYLQWKNKKKEGLE